MLGKAEWFTYRVEGWGIQAKTWQGWVYIGIQAAVLITIIVLPLPPRARNILLGIVGGVALLDVLSIMVQLGQVHDERARMHQLIIERNCSFAAVFSLVAAGAWQMLRHRAPLWPEVPFDPMLVGVLLVMAFTKLGSTLYLRWKM